MTPIEFDLEKSDNRRHVESKLTEAEEKAMPHAAVVAGALVARAVLDLADAIREAAQEKRVRVRP